MHAIGAACVFTFVPVAPRSTMLREPTVNGEGYFNRTRWKETLFCHIMTFSL